MKGYQMETLKITKLFLIDHEQRDLPMPEIVKETKQHYFIQIDWANIGYTDLYDDAEYYAGGTDWLDGMQGIRSSARAVLKNMEKTKGHESYERQTMHHWFIETFNIRH